MRLGNCGQTEYFCRLLFSEGSDHWMVPNRYNERPQWFPEISQLLWGREILLLLRPKPAHTDAHTHAQTHTLKHTGLAVLLCSWTLFGGFLLCFIFIFFSRFASLLFCVHNCTSRVVCDKFIIVFQWMTCLCTGHGYLAAGGGESTEAMQGSVALNEFLICLLNTGW